MPPPPPKKPRHEEKPRPERDAKVKEELQKEERRNKPPKKPKRGKSSPRAGSSRDRPPPPPPTPPADPESSSEEESEEEEEAADPIVLQEGPGAIQVPESADSWTRGQMCLMANEAVKPVGLSAIVDQLPPQPGQYLKYLRPPGLFGGLTKLGRGRTRVGYGLGKSLVLKVGHSKDFGQELAATGGNGSDK